MPLFYFHEGAHFCASVADSDEVYSKSGTLLHPSEPQLNASLISLDWYRGGRGIRLLRIFTEAMIIDNFHDRSLVGISIVRNEGIVFEILFIPILIPIAFWTSEIE